MRLFIGVELDDHVRTAAAAIAESLKRGLGRAVEARWIGSANLHITLWFLGEVEESRVEPVIRALDTPFRETAFDLEITGAGVFPATGAPRVIWLAPPVTHGTGGETAVSRLRARAACLFGTLDDRPDQRGSPQRLIP
jgi:2'-5' RNA ligase